jgi:hypothetical protein
LSEKLKTIGVDRERVWKVLKEIALEKECTLSEVIEDLLEKRNHGQSDSGTTGQTDGLGEQGKNRPDPMDQSDRGSTPTRSTKKR